MRKKQIPADEILSGMANCFEHYLLNYARESFTVEEFIKRLPYFCFSGNHYFCFSAKKVFTGTGMENIALYKLDSNPEGSFWHIKIPTFKRVLPFIKFEQDINGTWNSGWYQTKQLFDLLPTRAKIIDNILKEL